MPEVREHIPPPTPSRGTTPRPSRRPNPRASPAPNPPRTMRTSAPARTGKASRRREDDDDGDRDQDEDRPRRGSRDEDDKEAEPGPRKKKGKKRKKGVSTVVLLILIGVGVLLLVAAIGTYFSSGGGEPDGPTGGPVTGPGADPGAVGGRPEPARLVGVRRPERAVQGADAATAGRPDETAVAGSEWRPGRDDDLLHGDRRGAVCGGPPDRPRPRGQGPRRRGARRGDRRWDELDPGGGHQEAGPTSPTRGSPAGRRSWNTRGRKGRPSSG